ncbi:MAG: hypothetical protein KGH84_10000 [Paracoccaceae bacterium]|nr:hypothetical protein [Paracoccaceae bacterium]
MASRKASPSASDAIEGETVELSEEIAALRKELAALATIVGRIGSAGVASMSEAAKARFAAGEGLADELAGEFKGAEARVIEHLRDKPWRSLGFAALGGFVLGLILRR